MILTYAAGLDEQVSIGRSRVTLCHMDQIGMRELRHRLRHYLSRVDAGEGFDVTVFGRPVAHLGPLNHHRPTLARLVEEGKVTPAIRTDTSSLPATSPVTTGLTATEALLAERQDDPR